MSALSLSGPVALLDEPSAEGRLLMAEGLALPSAPLPLLALHAGVNPLLGRYGADPVGTVTAWDVADGGVLEVLGDVYDDQLIPAGKYPCGLEVRFEPEDAEQRPDERFPEQGLLVVRRCKPLAVVLHLPGSTGRAPWPQLPPLDVAR